MSHQVRYNRKTRTVVIQGHIDTSPFAATIDATNKTAHWMDDHLPDPPPHTGGEVGKKADCPGCGKTLRKLIRGGIGWAKELLDLDQVPYCIGVSRQECCETCPSGCYEFGICRDDWPDRPDEEQGCGCVLALKVLQASEECPHKHWLKYA